MASAIAAGFGAECINFAAIAICEFNSFVTLVVAPLETSPTASFRRRGTDRSVTARSRGEELLMATSCHSTLGAVDVHRACWLRQVG